MNNNQQGHLPEKVLQKFIENQAEEIKLRAQEIELRRQTDKNSFEYAKLALEAQAKDLQSQRDTSKNSQTHQYFFITAITAITLVFILIALYFNKDQIVMEIIKAVIYFGGGGASGYVYGKYRYVKIDQKVGEKATI